MVMNHQMAAAIFLLSSEGSLPCHNEWMGVEPAISLILSGSDVMHIGKGYWLGVCIGLNDIYAIFMANCVTW